MVKKVFLAVLVVSALVFSRLGADSVTELEQAEKYQRDGNYEQAEATYKSIVTGHPGTDDALEAQAKLIILYVSRYKLPEAEKACQELVTNFSRHENLAGAVNNIADEYCDLGKYDKAKQLWQYVLDNWPQNDEAMRSQQGVVLTSIMRGDEKAARAAIDKLLADYPSNEGIAKVIYNIADRYREFEKYEKANRLYQYILTNWPDGEQAMWSQQDTARVNITLGDDTAAEDAIDKLLADFRGKERIAKAVDRIADKYRGAGKYEKARQLYQYVLANWPDYEDLIESQVGIVKTNIRLGDEEAADAALGKLLVDFSEHSALPEGLDDVAEEYEKPKKYDKAKSIYQQIMQEYPDSPFALKAELALRKIDVLSLIESGKDSEAQTVMDSLIADFSGHAYLPAVVYEIGDEYYLRAFKVGNEGSANQAGEYFQKAAGIFEIVTTELPGSGITPKAWRCAGDCYRKLGEYENSVRCYQKMVDDYPGYDTTWNALFLNGRNYENLKKTGALSRSEADANTKAAYELLLDRYPDCKAAKYARYWLSRHNPDMERPSSSPKI